MHPYNESNTCTEGHSRSNTIKKKIYAFDYNKVVQKMHRMRL